MKIESANIKFASRHQLQKQNQTSESLRSWKTERQRPATPKVQLEISQAAQTLQTEKTGLDLNANLDANQSLTMLIIRRMFKDITGEELKFFSPEQLQTELAGTGTTGIEFQPPPTAPTPASAPSNTSGVGMVYQRTNTYSETETSSFSAEGIIKIQDGQEINFSAALNMSREFSTQTQLTVTAGEPEKKDPLVINFNGKAAELSDTRFKFDIDSDGSLDQISMLKPDSGFLALDKNNDGIINNGKELFGAQTGQGFQELAQYDQDHNNFIDENDAIYQKLRIWQQHEDGSQQLIALGDKNIGAIYLGHATTPFQLKNADNKTLGDVASTGIYLTEQGTVGTVQQIDLTV